MPWLFTSRRKPRHAATLSDAPRSSRSPTTRSSPPIRMELAVRVQAVPEPAAPKQVVPEPTMQEQTGAESAAPEQAAPEQAAPEPLAIADKFHVRVFINPVGLIGMPEFENRLLEMRRIGVTGTDARKLVRLDGTPSAQRERLMQERLSGIIRDASASSAGSVSRKPAIATLLERRFEIEYNTALCVGLNPRHLAIPDGIGHGVISEIKVSGSSWEQTARAYRDELQWQLHVTGSERVLLAVEGRHDRLLQQAWIERDESRISRLIEHADLFVAELDERRGSSGWQLPASSSAELEDLKTAS